MVSRCCLVLIFRFYFSTAQSNLQEWIALSVSDPEHAESLYLQIQEFIDNPIAINFCDHQELLETGLLNEFQAHNLIRYRERNGEILTYKELILIKGFDAQIIKLLRPILDFRRDPIKADFSPKALTDPVQGLILFRCQFKQATDRNDLWSSPLESRLRVEAANRSGMHLALNIQKDPGEINPMDHTSGFLRYKGHGFLKQLVLGDFHFHYGQGISLWSGMALDPQAIGSNFARNAKGLRPFAGNEENRFFRGLAVELGKKNWNLQSFTSFRKLDAREETHNGKSSFKPVASGYHRSDLEISRKDRLGLYSNALRIAYNGLNFRSGILILRHHFDQNLVPSANLYESLNPLEKNYVSFALDFQIIIAGFHGKGEIAWDKHLNPAFSFTWQRHLNDKIRYAQQIRRFQTQYNSFWNNPVAISGKSGESGLVNLLEIEWSRIHKSQLRHEYAHFSWPRYQTIGPSQISSAQLIHSFQKGLSKAELRLRVFNEKGLEEDERRLLELSTFEKSKVSLRIVYWIQPLVSLKMRSAIQYQIPDLNSNSSSGYFLSQDWQSKIRKSLIINWRTALSNGARFYDYEPDIRYGFALPSLGSGQLRNALLLRWKLKPWILELKLVNLKVQGNRKYQWELKFQCGYQW